MSNRLLAAVLFGGASAAFWAVCALFPPFRTGLALNLGAASTVATIIVAALAAPLFASDDRGGWIGTLIVFGSFALGAFLFAFILLFTNSESVLSIGFVEAALGVVELFLYGLIVGGITFLLPALVVGVFTGRLYVRLRLRLEAGAV